MVRRSRQGAPSVRALLLGFSLGLFSPLGLLPLAGAPRATAQDSPSATATAGGTATAPTSGPNGTVPMDLTSGKTDITPLSHSPVGLNEAFDPQSPPQTVEGTLVSVDPSGLEATVRTADGKLVKMGIPPDVYVSRDGHDSSVSDMKPGDQIFATVETANGVRAVRIVSAAPTNPLVSIIGIPVLLLIALAIWWTGRNRARHLAEEPARA